MKLTQIKNLLTRLHNNESGDIPVGPILVIGLVVIPLVIAIMVFGEELTKFFKDQWGEVDKAEKKSKIKF